MPGIVHLRSPSRVKVFYSFPARPLLAVAGLALSLAGCGGSASVRNDSAPGVSPQTDTTPAITARMAAAQETLNQMTILQERLYRVAAPLLINNADLCKTQARNLLGFTAKNRFSYPGEFADAAQGALGYGDQLQVSGVLAGSGAARAGLRKGDTLVSAEGKTLASGPNAETVAAGVLGPLASSRATISMAIDRKGAIQTLAVPVTRACAFKVELGNSDNVNSYADGQRMLITRGMINFAQNDEAIAFVMAKDLAHNILNHPVTQRQSGTIGSMIDNLANIRPDTSMLITSGGIKPMPAELDAAADSLGLYLAARAGYNVDNATRFWQRLASQYPATVLSGYTAVHPATAARLAAIAKTAKEIKAKQAGKKVLLP